ncbi:hypothetical protein Tco_0894967 [Tanacetum coccineum]|uniref:Uncharacterized protein n=1 Tax=Tanacetum coccineum TaxID=301880 RepID=A0ABQ5CD77_9ASTR
MLAIPHLSQVSSMAKIDSKEAQMKSKAGVVWIHLTQQAHFVFALQRSTSCKSKTSAINRAFCKPLRQLEACIKEALRRSLLNGSLIRSRSVLEDGVLDPENTVVSIFPSLMHYDGPIEFGGKGKGYYDCRSKKSSKLPKLQTESPKTPLTGKEEPLIVRGDESPITFETIVQEPCN